MKSDERGGKANRLLGTRAISTRRAGNTGPPDDANCCTFSQRCRRYSKRSFRGDRCLRRHGTRQLGTRADLQAGCNKEASLPAEISSFVCRRCTQTSTSTQNNVSSSFDHCFLREDQTSGHAALNTLHCTFDIQAVPSESIKACSVFIGDVTVSVNRSVSHTEVRFQNPNRHHRTREPTSTNANSSSKHHETWFSAETEMMPSNLQRPKKTTLLRYLRLGAATPETQKYSRPITATHYSSAQSLLVVRHEKKSRGFF